jgi:hypothetical protein
MRSLFSLRFIVVFFTLSLARASAVPISRADAFVQNTLDLIDRHNAQRERLCAPAEATAQRLLSGGRLFLAGDSPWVAEGYGRAGGLQAATLLTDANQAQPGDVVWLGRDLSAGEDFSALIDALAARKCLVLVFGGNSGIPPLHDVIRIEPLTSANASRPLMLLANILSLWTETAELAAATARQGRTLVFLQSHSVDGGRARNALYAQATFHDGLPMMASASAGTWSHAYLDDIRLRVTALRDRALPALISLGADLARRTHDSEKPVLMSLGHMLPEAVDRKSPWFRYAGIAEERDHLDHLLKPEGLFIFIGYVSVPLDLWRGVRRAKAHAAWIVSPLPGEVDFHEFGDTVIDQQWQVGDASVTAPGYDIRILPPSGVLQLVTYAVLIAAAEGPSSINLSSSPTGGGLEAMQSLQPVVVDGKLDDPVWATATAYPLCAVPKSDGRRPAIQEAGSARFAWDDRYFYVALDFIDSDVVAECDADGAYHYRFGDVGEVFLKPADRPWYWECYVTPKARQTTFFYPSRGRLSLPSTLRVENQLIVGAQIQGTLNAYRDRDHGWTAEMAIPIVMLKAQGDAFGPGSRWTVQVGRYNYSAHLPALELSSVPELSKADFHLIEEFAPLRFVATERPLAPVRGP